MNQDPVVDLERLRRSCGHCSLQQLCLPAGISVGDLSQLDEIVRQRRPLKRGQQLFRAGDALASVYVARAGALKTVTVSESGEEELIGFHLPGDLLGLDALGGGRHRCDAVALGDVEVCEVPYQALAGVAAQLPSLQAQLLRVIGKSFGRAQDRMQMLVRRQASERIALFLHGLGARYANIGESPTRFRLPMSREDIAHFLGLALETVSRGFTRLQDDGVIAVAGRRIEVLAPAELDRLAHGSDAGPPLRTAVRRG